MPEGQIQVYGTKWRPDCVRVKQAFGRHKITCTWYDIEENEHLRSFIERANWGYKSVPTIVFPDGSILVEPSNTELEKKLVEVSYR